MSKRLALKYQKQSPSQVRAREEEQQNLNPTTAELNFLKGYQELVEKLGKEPTNTAAAEALQVSEGQIRKYLLQLTRKGLLDEVTEPRVVGRKLSDLGKRWLKQLG